MAAPQPLLNFLDYKPARLKIEPVVAYRPDQRQEAQIETTFSVARADADPQRFGLVLSCRFYTATDDQNLPYETEFALLGEFWSLQELREGAIPARVANNALMLLYGVARGIVGQATAGGVHGRFVLPTVVFDELVDRATSDPNSGVAADPAPATNQDSSKDGTTRRAKKPSRSSTKHRETR